MRASIALSLVCLVASAMPARATSPDAIADQPAATLLLPYFQVSVPPATGLTTIFSVTDVNAEAHLVHVTIWSDLAVPVLAFDMYLTGYDVQSIDLADVLAGRLPRTAPAGQDPDDTISPVGPFSIPDLSFPGCTGVLPGTSPLPAATVAHLQAALTGKPSATFGGQCAGRDLGDGIARGFVTVDVVNQCSLQFPNSPGYFVSGGFGVASDANHLVGDFQLVNRSAKKAVGGNLVAIQAFPPGTFLPGDYTFYGRFTGWTAADDRQPLMSAVSARYANGGAGFPARTALLVWRDPKVDQHPLPCGTDPLWYPLNQTQIVIFDEKEGVQFPPVVTPPPPDPIPFPAAAQRVVVGSSAFPVDFDAGWLYLNFNTYVTVSPNPPVDPNRAQAWVIVAHDDPDVGAYGTRGRLRTAMPAFQLQSAGAP